MTDDKTQSESSPRRSEPSISQRSADLQRAAAQYMAGNIDLQEYERAEQLYEAMMSKVVRDLACRKEPMLMRRLQALLLGE